jgi:REP element-mobilizing transposase RayT
MKLSDIGEIANTEWLQSFEIRKEIKLDTYVIMPNHIHAIVYLDSTVGANGGLPSTNKYQISKNGLPPTNKFQIPKNENNKNPINKRANCHSPLHMKPRSLSSFVAGFKSTVSRKIGFSVWQRNYYDHIIRNDEDLDNIRKYIENNPTKWSEDEDNPINKK